MSEKPFKIFVVEDSEWYNRLLVHTLSLNPDYEVKSFFNGKEFLNCLHESPDIVTLDYSLPDYTGMEILKRIREENNDIQVILISEQENIDTVVSLLKMGAYDYISKTEDIKDRLINTVRNITQWNRPAKRDLHPTKRSSEKVQFPRKHPGRESGN